MSDLVESIYRRIRRAQRDRETPGRETFSVRIRGGTARVVCNNLYKVYIEATFEDGRVKKWIRQTMTAAELLVRLGASDPGESEADKIPLEMGPEPISPDDAGTQNFTRGK